MNTPNIVKKALLGLTVAIVSAISVVAATPAQAAQIPYNPDGTRTSTTPVFNIFTDVPNYIGNEADFVRLRKSNGDPTVPANQNNFVDPLSATCAVGEKFDVRTYVHNGADPARNNNGSGTAVAHNVNVAMTAKLGETRRSFPFTSTISASNANSVTDSGTLNCQKDVQLKLVASSVRVYSMNTGWTGAPDSSVNGNLKVGSRTAGSGDQWGCWDDRIIVVYVVEVVETPKVPVFTCDAITVDKIAGTRNYRYGVRSTATNGAALKTVKYNFSDNTNKTASAAPFSVDKQFAAEGEFTTTTDLTFTVNGADKVVTDAKCATTIKTDVEPCPTNPNYPKGSPECEPCPTKPEFPKNSKECVELPPVIPSTGAGSMIGGLIGSSATAYGAYALYQKRKALKSL